MNKYAEYKDSGIDWIGEIPSKWNVLQFKNTIDNIKNGTSTTQETAETSYLVTRIETISTGEINFDKVGYVEWFDGLENYKLNKGDILLSNINSLAMIGNSAQYLGGQPLYSGMNLLRIVPSKKVVHRWLYYFIISHYFKNSITSEAKPAINQASIPTSKIKSIPTVLPPIEDQNKIADYLDRKTAHIDSIIADKEKLIELLKEKRQAIISEAVTRGLDSSAPMKDSGVDWIGQIPKHWEMSQSRWLFSLRKDRAFPDDEQLTASQQLGIVYQKDYMEQGSRVVQVITGEDILKHVEPNDFVISMRSFQGGIEWSGLRGKISSAYVMLIPDQRLVYCPFFKWLLKSDKYIRALQSTSNLVRDGQALRYSNFKQVPLPIISLDEQEQISNYLDMKTSQIESLTQDISSQILLLKEYRQSVISEAVTGKVATS